MMAVLIRAVARHPVLAFMVIGLGPYFLIAAIRPIAEAEVLPFGGPARLPLHGLVGAALGVGLGAFLVTGALAGRDGVVDLARRSVRWRVPVRWYLIALFTVPVGATLIALAIYGLGAVAPPADGWPRALAEVAAVFLLQLVLFQLAEEIGFTGFLQHHWQDRYHPMKLTLYVALLWALWHLPDHFAEEGWGVEAWISAPIIFAVEFVSLFFARALFVWFYNVTAFSVLLVAIFHASFDASINQLSHDIVPGSNNPSISSSRSGSGSASSYMTNRRPLPSSTSSSRSSNAVSGSNAGSGCSPRSSARLRMASHAR